jgi:hypothetical protein
VSAETARPKPPAWPEKGTPEYDQRIAKMQAGHARRLAQGKKPSRNAPEPKPGAFVGEADLIDVGDPNPARMAPEPREKAKGKPASRGKGEFEQVQVHKNIKLGLDILARMPGRDHWHREDDEVEMIAEPATRCLNRLDKKLIERLRTVSDPAALVFACVMILGPSIGEELKHVGTLGKGGNRAQGGRPVAAAEYRQPQQQPQGEPEPWAGGYGPEYPGPVSANGARPTPAVEGIPATF